VQTYVTSPNVLAANVNFNKDPNVLDLSLLGVRIKNTRVIEKSYID